MATFLQRISPAWMGYGKATAPASVENRNVSIATCTPTDIWGQPSDWSSYGGSVNMQSALSVPAIWDAVKKVSETLATLPKGLYEKTDTGSRRAEAPALNKIEYLITTEPSPNVTAADYWTAMYARACFGDAFSKIHRSGTGRPTRFELMTGDVYVGQKDDGQLFYVWNWSRGQTSGSEVLMAQEVLHIRGFNLDAKRGLNVSSVHRDSIGFAIGANKYGNNFFHNNAAVDKVLLYRGTLTPPQRVQLETKINAVSGVHKTGSTLVLDAEMDLKRIGLSPEESMLNESRTFQVNETGGRIFGVPIHLLQNMDRATFNNIETMNTTFVTLTLRPWAIKAEQEMLIKLLTRDEKESGRYFFRHNFEGLLRGDTASRAAFYASGILNGWITRDEVREKENLNTLPGLDRPLVPANMNILGEDGEIQTTAQQTQNTPTPGQPGSGGKKQPDGTSQGIPAAGA